MILPTFRSLADEIASLFLDTDAKQRTCPIWLAQSHNGQDDPAQGLAPRYRDWLKAIDFKPNSGSWALLAGDEGIGGVTESARRRIVLPFAPTLAETYRALEQQAAEQR